jgi:DNA processing protein
VSEDSRSFDNIVRTHVREGVAATLDSERHLSLLSLCALDGANWHVVAREAQHPGGLDRLQRGELSEKTKEARLTQKSILAGEQDLGAARRRVEEELHRSQGAGAKLVTVLDDDYPANLRVIYNLPPFLFYRGRLDRDDARSVAVVGTREASNEGLASARRMACLLARANVTVLSGLARGIDTAAHEETLSRGGRTIAVLGTGILGCYPKENADLAERITESGALVSQFWPSQPPTKYNFPRRNVVTSGLSQGTVVIEASKTSGAKMQARLALDHGKRVFLVSRLVTSQPWAQRYVAERNAIEVRTVDDVLDRLRSSEAIEQLSAGRRQLAIELA